MTARRAADPFRSMLAWSCAAHGVLLLTLVFGAWLSTPASALPSPSGRTVVRLGESGPLLRASDGAPTPRRRSAAAEASAVSESSVEATSEPRSVVQDVKPPASEPGSEGVGAADDPPADGANREGTAERSGDSAQFDQDFEYAYYVNTMLQRIDAQWQRVTYPDEVRVVVGFTILANGDVVRVGVEETSGVAILDRLAVRAVKRAAPMPPLPRSYPRDRVGVHLRFTYTDEAAP